MDDARDGLSLARHYWADVVRPILDEGAPTVRRAVARIGSGSEVLGLDDAMSRDHDWGLRLQVFVPPGCQAEVRAVIDARLPDTYAGHPTRLTLTGESTPSPGVDVLSVDEFMTSRLGFDPRRSPSAADWLSLTGQAVLEVTAGAVFEDADGGLTSLRRSLRWYPDDLWRYVIACAWRRIDEELPLLQRAGDRGDDLGSRIIAARLVDVAMHLAFLVCRRWAPYSKWRGTVFAQLPLTGGIAERLTAVLTVSDAHSRAQNLALALQGLAEQQGRVGLPTAAPVCVPFWDRPYLQVDQDFLADLPGGIRDPEVRRLPPGLGSVEQRSDNVSLLVDPAHRRAFVGCNPTSAV